MPGHRQTQKTTLAPHCETSKRDNKGTPWTPAKGRSHWAKKSTPAVSTTLLSSRQQHQIGKRSTERKGATLYGPHRGRSKLSMVGHHDGRRRPRRPVRVEGPKTKSSTSTASLHTHARSTTTPKHRRRKGWALPWTHRRCISSRSCSVDTCASNVETKSAGGRGAAAVADMLATKRRNQVQVGEERHCRGGLLGPDARVGSPVREDRWAVTQMPARCAPIESRGQTVLYFFSLQLASVQPSIPVCIGHFWGDMALIFLSLRHPCVSVRRIGGTS